MSLIGSVFIPLADMIRVTLVRIVDGSSPFKADRQHIHHLLLDLFKGNHMLTTGLLLISQLLIIVVYHHLSDLGSVYLIAILIAFFLIYVGITYLLKKAVNKID